MLRDTKLQQNLIDASNFLRHTAPLSKVSEPVAAMPSCSRVAGRIDPFAEPTKPRGCLRGAPSRLNEVFSSEHYPGFTKKSKGAPIADTRLPEEISGMHARLQGRTHQLFKRA